MEYTGLKRFMENDCLRILTGLAAELDVDAFLVGGGIRDSLLGREPNDLDFALSGVWEKLPRSFAERITGTFFWLDEERRQGRVVRKNGGEPEVFDFAPLHGGTIRDDLAARDFTINAMAIPLSGNCHELIDPLNGRDDLRHCLVRACAPSAFEDDPLRLLRGVRFAAELSFAIEAGTWAAICAKAALLKEIAGERVRDELFRTLAAPACGASFTELRDSGLWETIHPVQGSSMEGGIARVSEAERICADVGELFPVDGERLQEYLSRRVEGGISLISLIKLAAFLGRGETESAATLAERLRLGRDAERTLELFSRDETPLYRVLEGTLSGRPIHRFFRDREPAGPGMLIIARCGGVISDAAFSRLIGYYLREYEAGERDLFLSGGEVMEILGVPPGRAVGSAMASLREAEGSGRVNSREEARAFIKNLLTSKAPMS